MKTLSDRTPARFGGNQKTDRGNACMCIQNHVKYKRQSAEQIWLNRKVIFIQPNPKPVTLVTDGKHTHTQRSPQRTLLGDEALDRAVEIAHWPVTCDSAGSAATGRSSQP
jgi:hypothetical protein